MTSIRRMTTFVAAGRLRPHVSVQGGMWDLSSCANGVGGQIGGGRVSAAGSAM